jgi:hypothetical protein
LRSGAQAREVASRTSSAPQSAFLLLTCVAFDSADAELAHCEQIPEPPHLSLTPVGFGFLCVAVWANSSCLFATIVRAG